MAGATVKAEIDGLDKVLQALDKLKKSVRNKYLRKAVNAAGRDILWAAKARTPKRYGILYKSLGRKVKVYRNNGVAVAIVGARKGFKQVVGTRKRDSRPGAKRKASAGDPIYADPVKYLHLVELGTTRTTAKKILKEALASVLPAVREKMRGILTDAIAELKR